jgi:hypothetical protein
MAVDKTGVVPADQAALAASFGSWVKTCYGSPVAAVHPPATPTSEGGGGGSSVVTLKLAKATVIDRVSIGEDLTFGQV